MFLEGLWINIKWKNTAEEDWLNWCWFWIRKNNYNMLERWYYFWRRRKSFRLSVMEIIIYNLDFNCFKVCKYDCNIWWYCFYHHIYPYIQCGEAITLISMLNVIMYKIFMIIWYYWNKISINNIFMILAILKRRKHQVGTTRWVAC